MKLHESYQRALEVVVQYQEIKDLMLRAISLPAVESDLLMRYQTTQSLDCLQPLGSCWHCRGILKLDYEAYDGNAWSNILSNWFRNRW